MPAPGGAKPAAWLWSISSRAEEGSQSEGKSGGEKEQQSKDGNYPWAPGRATNKPFHSSLNKLWETWVIISRQIGEFEVAFIMFCHYFKLLLRVSSASHSSVLLCLVPSIWVPECPPSPFSQISWFWPGIPGQEFSVTPTAFPSWLLNSDCIHRGDVRAGVSCVYYSPTIRIWGSYTWVLLVPGKFEVRLSRRDIMVHTKTN